MTKKRESGVSVTVDAQTVLERLAGIIFGVLQVQTAFAGTKAAAILADVRVMFGFPSERATAGRKINGDNISDTPAGVWQAWGREMHLNRLDAEADRATIMVSPAICNDPHDVAGTWAKIGAALYYAALHLILQPELAPVYSKKLKSYSAPTDRLMVLSHPDGIKDSDGKPIMVKAKVVRFTDGYKEAAKALGLTASPKDYYTAPTIKDSMAVYLREQLDALAVELLGEATAAANNETDRINMLPAPPFVRPERTSEQTWLRKVISTIKDSKGKPLMVLRLTDKYRQYVDGSAAWTLALVPSNSVPASAAPFIFEALPDATETPAEQAN